MAIISKNEQLDNIVEALAPRIEILWEPRDNSGSVMFQFEKFDRRISDWFVNSRSWMGTLNASLQDIYADTYTYTHPMTGEEKTVDGMDVLAIVKAVTDKRWEMSLNPVPPVAPEGTE